ncbi:MAG TPA: MutL protein [Anaerolineae bacterium]|nr:MutL protein [Anaerolineae bacterium]
MHPDIILLAGGTDGGEAKTILHNAVMLTTSSLRVPVVVAGNKAVGGRVMDILRWHGMDARLTENVMPRLNALNVEPAQQAIRQVFLERIVEAKGLDRAEAMLEAVAMPTPAAVLAGARLLADGLADGEEEPGWGELLVVDVGGATTDVHSVAEGTPTRSDVLYRGLPEPRLKRTVEGDLGLRVNAPSLLAALGEARVRRAMGVDGHLDLAALAEQLSQEVGRLPQTDEEWALEAALGRGAVELAVARHVGRLEELWTPQGLIFVQRGKDLSRVDTVVGTGGVFAHHPQAWAMLRGAVADGRDPLLLAPRQPHLYLDRRYIFWAAGLLADHEPYVALRLLKRYLVRET